MAWAIPVFAPVTEQLVAATVSEFGGIDVLANNAGGLVTRKAIAEMSLEHRRAMMTMTRGLAKELGPAIRVNALCPGMIDTDFHNIHMPDAARKGFEAAAPVKRQGVPEDAANLVLFLACDDSAFITGANIDINGGMLFS